MLAERFDRKQLARLLVPRDRWHPWPKATERRRWMSLPARVRRAQLALGVQARSTPWPDLPATLYLDCHRTGNRERFQTPHFARRRLLGHLLFAECVEGKGRFLDPLADRIWSLCEESSWCLPAHISMQKAGPGLPDTVEPIPDLFAAETAALLAWTHYLLGPALDGVSPRLCPRIAAEVQTRILTPCLARDDFWWMGFRNPCVNNWNPWINSNWLAAALLLEEDPARRTAAVAKSLRSLDVFLKGYPADGGCDEGPSYWTRAGASLFDCLELLHSASRGAIDLFQQPLVREIGRFIVRAHIHENWFLNFADAPAVMTPPAELVFRYGRRIRDPQMQQLASFFLHRGHGPKGHLPDAPSRGLPALFAGLPTLTAAPRAPLPRDAWLPDTQVMVARSRAGRPDGLTLAAKGGHNAENHNHNDVGHFVVYADGQPVLIDAGVETYTRKTFSPHRYDLWTMQSQYHNLPTINGVMQQDGRDFRARAVRYSADARRAVLSLDIAGAYPAKARLISWVRQFTLERGGDVLVEDRYQAAAAPKDLFLSLLTPCTVQRRPGLLVLGPRRLPQGRRTGRARLTYESARLRARVETVRITDPQLRNTWGPRLFRIVLRAVRPGATGAFRLRLTK